jgi:hypothetical protein
MRWAIGVRRHADRVEGLGHALVQLRSAQAEVHRSEGDVVADRAHEELVIGVLEDDADAAPDLQEVVLGDRQP